MSKDKVLCYTGVDNTSLTNVGTVGHVDWSFSPKELEGSVNKILDDQFSDIIDTYNSMCESTLEKEAFLAIYYIYPNLLLNKLTDLENYPILCSKFHQRKYPCKWELVKEVTLLS